MKRLFNGGGLTVRVASNPSDLTASPQRVQRLRFLQMWVTLPSFYKEQ